jgi:hypothetical protein
MATQAQVRRIALSFPETEQMEGSFAFFVRVKDKPKRFAWVWRERVDPKKPKVPNPAVLVVSVATLADKDVLISHDPRKYFTEPHYDGYAAVLVRLAEVRVPELRELLEEAWRSQSAKPTKTVANRPRRTAAKKWSR